MGARYLFPPPQQYLSKVCVESLWCRFDRHHCELDDLKSESDVEQTRQVVFTQCNVSKLKSANRLAWVVLGERLGDLPRPDTGVSPFDPDPAGMGDHSHHYGRHRDRGWLPYRAPSVV